MNIVEQVFLWYDWASFGYMPNSGVAESGSRLRNHNMTSKVAAQVCTPTSNGGEFSLLHILSSMSCHLCFFLLDILTGDKMESQSHFDLHFTDV